MKRNNLPTSNDEDTLMTDQELTIQFKKSGVIGFDADLCVGCGICMLMCSLYHEGTVSPSQARIRMERNPMDAEYQANICQQCLAPSCYVACPEIDAALCIDQETGIKYVDAGYCVSCDECIQACPFDPKRIYTYSDSRIAYKCDLCISREEGPICVEYCPVNALTIIEANERC